MKIIIKGERGVGKSTLLQSLLYEIKDFDGFATDKVDFMDEAKVYIRPIKESLGHHKHSIVATIKGPHNILVNQKAFDDFTKQYLRHMTSKWLVFDELGFLENNTHEFKPFIRACFETHGHVIAVIKSYKSNIVDDLINDMDYNIFELTKENRDSILKEIQNLIRDHVLS